MSERSVVELLERIRSERAEAWERASLFARHADRLERALIRITECPCVEQYTCAERAVGILEYSNIQLKEDMVALASKNIKGSKNDV